MGRLRRAFFARAAPDVARDLLGALLVHVDGGVRRAARIVEVEAYHGVADRASHARFGSTPRTEVMFGPAGRAYVFVVYGRNHCVNAVTGADGEPSAVLLRAGEPVAGCLGSTRGPGNLARALGLTRERHDRADLCGPTLFFEAGPPPARIAATPRVNVDYAGRWARRRWRFLDAGSPWVSGPAAPGVSRPRRGGRRGARRGGPRPCGRRSE